MTHRRFELHRDTDLTGISGTGVVAEGVAFSDGVVALRWRSDWPTSVVFHDRGIEAVAAVHGHGGATRIVWLDPEDAQPTADDQTPPPGTTRLTVNVTSAALDALRQAATRGGDSLTDTVNLALVVYDAVTSLGMGERITLADDDRSIGLIRVAPTHT